MKHTYKISGMTCSGCQATVQSVLSKVKGVEKANVDVSKGEATIEMAHHIPTNEFQIALKDYPKYQISENGNASHEMLEVDADEPKTWLETYKPILLIFGYILGVTVLIEVVNGSLVWTRWMEHFMAGFFLVFSFFKLLNIRAFAESYAMYDIVAKKWYLWGYLYAFVELSLGIAFLTGFNPLVTNAITFVVMSISVIGVLISVLNKRKIRCACLGAVFNLPMSTVTIVEDVLMIGMSTFMLIYLI